MSSKEHAIYHDLEMQEQINLTFGILCTIFFSRQSSHNIYIYKCVCVCIRGVMIHRYGSIQCMTIRCIDVKRKISISVV